MLGGYKTTSGCITTELAKYLGGKPESTIIGDGAKVACTHASFANSYMNNALDFDDCLFGHPGFAIVPPAIALAESTKASGKELITSVVLGYEVYARIAAAIQPSIRYRSQKWSGIWGLNHQIFGSMVAASRLLSLNETEILNAFGLAGIHSPVPTSVAASKGMFKNRAGIISELGVLSALMAKKGCDGPKNILDEKKGYWQMVSSDKCNFERMTRGLGKKYEIMEASFKPYPCCRYIHPAIDAAIRLVGKNKIDLDEIKI